MLLFVVIAIITLSIIMKFNLVEKLLGTNSDSSTGSNGSNTTQQLTSGTTRGYFFQDSKDSYQGRNSPYGPYEICGESCQNGTGKVQ